MNIETFSKVRTSKDMENHLQLLHSVADEHGTDFSHMLRVEGTDFPNLSYVLSVTTKGYISSHFFSYTDEETGLFGLCEYSFRKRSLEKVCNPLYNQLISTHPALWLGFRDGLYYDVLLSGVVVLEGVQSYDVLHLGDCFSFLQLDYEDKTSLICLDLQDVAKGYHIVESRDDFENWFRRSVAKRGYEGVLDMLSVSELFGTYFEVINTIFEVSDFEPIHEPKRGS